MTQDKSKTKEGLAVLALSERLAKFGQFARVIALLDLADWLMPASRRSAELRLDMLMKLERWDDALDVIISRIGVDQVNGRTLARLYWGLGDINLGNTSFRKSQQR